MPEWSLWTIQVFDGMQLVIAARQIAAVAEVRDWGARRNGGAKLAGDGGAQVRGCGRVDNPDLEAINIRRILGMPEGRTAWLTAIFDVNTEDHIRILLAGLQGHLAHAGDGNGIGVGSPWLGSAHPIAGVAEAGVRQRRQAVASEARATQAVEDACGVETLQSAIARVTNMLPLTANVRPAVDEVADVGG